MASLSSSESSNSLIEIFDSTSAISAELKGLANNFCMTGELLWSSESESKAVEKLAFRPDLMVESSIGKGEILPSSFLPSSFLAYSFRLLEASLDGLFSLINGDGTIEDVTLILPNSASKSPGLGKSLS